MKYLQLGGTDLFTTVDDEDFEKASNFKWYLKGSGKNLYASTGRRVGNVLLHRIILGITDSTIFIDHIDRNGLNNCRANLRIASYSVNAQNMRPYGKSGYKGVSFRKESGLYRKSYWYSRIKCEYKSHWLGQFPPTPCGELLAAVKYDEAAIQFFGKDAAVNFK